MNEQLDSLRAQNKVVSLSDRDTENDDCDTQQGLDSQTSADRSMGDTHENSVLPENIPFGFILNDNGVFQILKKNDGSETAVHIAGRCWVSAETRANDTASDWGAIIHWYDRDGKLRECATPRSRFHESNASLAQELASLGLEIIPTREKQLLKYLGSMKAQKRMKAAAKLGWLDDKQGGLTFVLPYTVLQKSAVSSDQPEPERIVFQPEQNSSSTITIHQRGTLEEWKDHVVKNCVGSNYFLFCLCLSFSSVLIKFAGRVQSFGVHPHTGSSKGKTTGAQVASSLWGCGADPADAPDQSYTRDWNCTANGTEGLCAAHNDLLLGLDEIGKCDIRDFGKLVYSIFGGLGKQAMNQKRQLKDQRTWRLVVLSTGEVSSRQKIEESGKTVKAGQMVRLMDIDLADVLSNETAESVNTVKQNCALYYGTAGPAFIQSVIDNNEDSNTLRHHLESLINSLDPLFQKLQKAEQNRGRDRFVFILAAGLMAQQLLNLPVTAQQITDAVLCVFNVWAKNSGELSDVDRGVLNVREFILRFKESRFRNIKEELEDEQHRPQTRDIAGYWVPTSDRFYFTKTGFQEACGGQSVQEILKELRRRQLLFIAEPDRFTSALNVDGKRIDGLYAVKGSLLEARECQ